MLRFVLLAPLLVIGEALCFLVGGAMAFLMLLCLLLNLAAGGMREALKQGHAAAARALRD